MRDRGRRHHVGHVTDRLSGGNFCCWSIAALFAEWNIDRHLRCAAAGKIDDNESGLLPVCAGQVADAFEFHSQLWPALGSADFPETGNSTDANRVRIPTRQSAVSI